MSVRLNAVRVLCEVFNNGKSLNQLLPKFRNRLQTDQEKALLQELCFGVSRWFFRLDTVANALLKKPLKKKDTDVYYLILIGLYQIIYMRMADYVAVSETVSCVKELKKLWAKALVNGVLRQFQRDQEKTLCLADGSEVGEFAHPDWLIRNIKFNHPDRWQKILEANNQRPPMSLRVNLGRNSRADCIAKLQSEGIECEPNVYSESALLLKRPCATAALPGFDEGDMSVQDGAAQLAADLLEVEPQQRVLDACAAPGGKTCHIVEKLKNSVHLLALDSDPERVAKIKENQQRLGLVFETHVIEAENTDKWWDGQCFDRILLDAPCSATGIIRRHPDIKLLRKETDISQYVETQETLLNALWPLLVEGGMLLYVTCSIIPEENELLITRFLARQDDASERIIHAGWGVARAHGRQILPGERELDGLYFVCLIKS